MKNFAFLIIFILCSCQVYNNPAADTELSPAAKNLLQTKGIRFHQKSVIALSNTHWDLDERLAPYADPKSSVRVLPRAGECANAGLTTIVTLGIIPYPCDNYVYVEDEDTSQGVEVTYEQNAFGWLAFPMAALPNHSLDGSDEAERRYFNNGIITALNRIVVKR